MKVSIPKNKMQILKVSVPIEVYLNSKVSDSYHLKCRLEKLIVVPKGQYNYNRIPLCTRNPNVAEVRNSCKYGLGRGTTQRKSVIYVNTD